MIIGFSGYAKTGKTEGAKILMKLFPERYFEIVGFSKTLKEIASKLTGIPADDFEKQEVKANLFFNITTGDVKWRKQLPKKEASREEVFIFEEPVESYPENSWLSIRCYLQDLGTNTIRSKYPNAWVIALMKQYDNLYLFDDTPNWIIPDLRFINEADAIKKRNGLVIRFNRPGYKAVNNHVSETEMDGYDYDHVITASNLTELETKLSDLLKTVLC